MTQTSALPLGSSVSVDCYELVALFNPKAKPPISFPNGSTIEVDRPLALIVFKLETAQGVQAGFTPSPIDWLDSDGRSIPTPAPFIVQRHSLDRVALLDVNVTAASVDFHLAIQIEYQGVVFSSSDPTILNKEEPPGGGPPGVKAKA